MDILSYSDFSLGFQRRVSGQRIPTSGTIEVTRRCPLNCVHCYNNLPIRDREAKSKELTYDEHCRIIDEITEAGCFWLLFTGGEIFVRKDFLDIYTYAKKKGLLITLFTNGVLMTPEIADYLAEWRPFAIEISLYGRTRETYERVTGAPGSYDRCMCGIRLLTERRLPLKLKTMAITINRHELWDMKRFVEEELGLEFKFDPMINPCIDCSQKPLSVRLTPEEVIELDLKDQKRVTEWKRFTDQFNGPVYAPGQSDEMFHCSAGFNTFAIDPYGMLNACILSSMDSYDLRKGSFKEGWDNAIFHLRHKKISRETKCIHCEIKSMCGMCPANAELENKDPEEPVDFLCHVAHLRAYAMQIPVEPHGECNYCRGGKEYENLMSAVNGLRNKQILSH